MKVLTLLKFTLVLSLHIWNHDLPKVTNLFLIIRSSLKWKLPVWRGVHEMGCSEVPASVRAWCPGFAYQLILQRSVLNPWRLGFWFGILWVVSAVSDNWRWTLTIPRMKERQRGLVCFRHNLSPWSLSSLTRCSACWIFALHLLVLGSKREQELFEDREGRVCKHPVWRILVEVGILMVVTSRHNY